MFPENSTTLHFEACATDSPGTTTTKPYPVTVPVLISNIHLQAQDKTPSQIMGELVGAYNIPEDKKV